MKAQLVVVQGKPEGKTIPLAMPKFKIGRGEGCHLRPNNDQVSREHALFEVEGDAVLVRDLGSRNGTEVNGKKLTAQEPYSLKNGDLVTIGPLTFAVSIEGLAPAAVAAGPPRKPTALDDVSHDEIDSWLVSDASKEPPDRPSGVYGGDTITIETMKAKERPPSRPTLPASKPTLPAAKEPVPAPAPAAKAPAPVEKEIEPFNPNEEDDGIEDLSRKDEANAEMPEELVDESNPFYVKKKPEAAPAAASKEPQKNSSDAANDILRKMMDRRKASKS